MGRPRGSCMNRYLSQTVTQVRTTMASSQSAALAAAVLFPVWRYDGASLPSQLVFTADCDACNVTAVVPKEVLAVQVAGLPLNDGEILPRPGFPRPPSQDTGGSGARRVMIQGGSTV
jgi:hypothetical protein